MSEKDTLTGKNTLQDQDPPNDNEDQPNLEEQHTIIDVGHMAEQNTVITATNDPKDTSPNRSPLRSLKCGEMFGHYRIEQILGRGGMGVVYKAFDEKLQRFVALKLISSEDLNYVQLKRFLQEAQATAKLEHPNIVKLFSTGEDPHHHLVMEYISGTTLSGKKFSYKEMASLCSKIASALHFAHEKGIVHRDIKPSNIMLTDEQEPKVMDFGLAKMLDVQQSLSSPGAILGTLAYMPLEQAEGRDVDRRTDVYSLGATIYELLCNRPPFEGQSHINILHQIYKHDIVSPTQLNPDIPRELEAICLKCLEKNADKRYNTAELLAQDLQNYVENRPIMAAPVTTWTYAKKFILRNKLLVTSLSIIFLLTIVAGSISYVQWQKAEIQAKLAQEQRQKLQIQNEKINKQKQLANEQRLAANFNLAKIAHARAQIESRNENWAHSGALAGKALEFIVDQEQHELKKKLKTLVKDAIHNHQLIWTQSSTDIHQVYVASEQSIIIDGGTLRYIDTFTGKETFKYSLDIFKKTPKAKPVMGIPTKGPKPAIKEMPVPTKTKKKRKYKKETKKFTWCFSQIQNSKLLIAKGNKFLLWNISGKKIEKDFANDSEILAVALSPNAKTIAILNQDETVQLWKATGEKQGKSIFLRQPQLKRAGKVIYKFRDKVAFAFVSDQQLRVDFDGYSRDFDIATQKFLKYQYRTGANTKKYFHNANLLVTLSQEEKKLFVYKFSSKQGRLSPMQEMIGNDENANANANVNEDPMNQNVIERQTSSSLHFSKMDTDILSNINFHNAQLAVSPDGSTVAVIEDKVYLWEIRFAPRQLPVGFQRKGSQQIFPKVNDSEDLNFLTEHPATVTTGSVLCMNDNHIMTTHDKNLSFWNLQGWQELRSQHIHPNTTLPKHLKIEGNASKSDFDFRTDLVPGWCIEILLKSQPQKTTSSLFQLQVTDTLTLEDSDERFLYLEKVSE